MKTLINHRPAAWLRTTAIAIAALATLHTAAQKQEYTFRQQATPSNLNRYATTIFMSAGKNVVDMTGSHYAATPQPISTLALNPAGINFITVGKDRKGSEAAVWSALSADNRIEKFNNKRFGSPSCAVYTPDARQIILATDLGIALIDAKTFRPNSSIPSDYIPTRMVMSSDGYYLATTDGHNVTVYNFEERKPRKTWSFDETVNDIAFDPSADQFGILTDDGLLTVCDTRNFGLKHSIDDLGDGLAFDFNFDGKYIAAAVSPSQIVIVNTLRDSDRETIDVPLGFLSDLVFINDSNNNTLLASNTFDAINVKRMSHMTPFFGKLVADEVADRMNEWLKMMPGESMDDYRARVNDESRARQQRLFEDEISTQLAGDPVAMAEVSLGKYDRAAQMLEVDFDNMPSIFLPVPEADLKDLTAASDLEFTDARYGIMPDDSFELIYAVVHNKATGKSYIYDNLDRKPLTFLDSDDNIVSIEIIQQQQMEEIKLQDLKEQVVAEAKNENVISDHTNIAVDSRVVPSYDANGKKILNYVISFTYDVEPGFSVHEDFGPGKYHVDQSGAASSMLKIVKEAFEGDFAQYIADGKKVLVKISGTADATPIVHGIPYDGVYGDFDNEIVYKNGQMTGLSVNTRDLIRQNEQLAFLRAYGVRDFLSKNVRDFDKMNADYQYHISVAEGKGSEFRRITTEFTLVDVF